MTQRVWMSTEQVAERYGVGRAAVLGWRKNGRIKGVKFGRCWRFAVEEITRFEQESAEAPA
jgi:excisionase family DNA binding protein